MTQPNLGRKISELRQRKGFTQSELAEKSNLNLRTIQRIETSEVTPRSYTVKTILSALGYDLDDLSDEKHGKGRTEKQWGRLLGYVRELFNLKTHKMKKLSVLTAFVALVTAGLFLTNSPVKAQKVDGWSLTGSKSESYTIGLDKVIYKSSPTSAFLESNKTKIAGFGTLMKSSSAKDYLGKRIKMTAYVKSLNVKDRAGMWLRIDSEEPRKMVGFDNMQNRPIKGTLDWAKYEIVLDVPMNSRSLNYGILLNGTGKVWLDDVSFEVVDDSFEVTGRMINPD